MFTRLPVRKFYSAEKIPSSISVSPEFYEEFKKFSSDIGWLAQDVAIVALDQFVQWTEKNPLPSAKEIAPPKGFTRVFLEMQMPKVLDKKLREIIRSYPHEDQDVASDIQYYVLRRYLFESNSGKSR